MKKVFIYLISIALVLSLVGISSVAAEGGTTGQVPITHNSGSPAHSTEVHYGLSKMQYSVSVPASFDFNTHRIMTGYVSVDNVVIGVNEVLNVTVQSTHDWNLVLHEGPTANYLVETIEYTMTYTNVDTGASVTTTSGDDPSTKSGFITVLSVPSNQPDYKELTFTLGQTSAAEYTGSYKDALTFTVDIQTITP